MFWMQLLIWAVGTLLMELVRPKPQIEDARPAGLGDFSFPTATEGRCVPLIWGKIKITGPNVVWYGGFRIEEITEEVKTGLFSSDDVVTGHKYYVGIQFALCRGPGVVLHHVWVNEKTGWLGTQAADGVSSGIYNDNILGGETTGGGGMAGGYRFYTGSKTQPVSAYLASQQSPDVAYRGTSYIIWEGGYVGNSTSIPPWSFLVSRIPDGLNLASNDPGAEEPYPGGCNPMNVLYEILTDTDWGLAVSPSEIDAANFLACASTLNDEGNGFAMLLDSARNVEDVIREVERQIDGHIYYDRVNSLWRCQLARYDYTPAGLPLFDESNVVELTDYTRQTWEETVNQVRVKYTDNDKEFNDSFALAQDMANNDLQHASVATEVSYPGVKNAALANKLAWRDLKVLAFPLGKINIKVNRDGFQLRPGSVFRFSWLRLGITDVVYRVQRLNLGNLDSDIIEVYAVQDVFAAGVGTFGAPISTGWSGDVQPAVAPDTDDTLVLEAPRQLVAADPYSSRQQPRVWMGARWPGGGTIKFDVYSRSGTSRPLSGTFNYDSSINRFLLVGALDADVPAYGSSATRPAVSYDIDVNEVDSLVTLVVDGGTSLVSNLLTIAYIDGEYLGFQQVTDQGGGVYRLAGLWRGLFHTAPKTHTAGTRVWFIGQSGGGISRDSLLSSHDEVDFQLRSRDALAVMLQGDTPIEEITLANVWRCPLAPRDPVLHASYAPASATLDTQYTTETGLSGNNARALKVAVTPRSWSEDDVTLDATLPADYLDDGPEFDFRLDLGGGKITDAITVSGTDAPVAYVLRNAVVVAAGANTPIPSSGVVRVTARHTIDGTDYTNPVPMEFTVGLTSSIQTDDLLHGGLTVNVAGTAVVYGETGTYNFNIGSPALPSGGILEASKNGGGYTTVVAAAATTGTLAVTAGDSVVLRFTQAPTSSQFFTVTGPTAEVGHGVLRA
jgi:hypothetical protein